MSRAPPDPQLQLDLDPDENEDLDWHDWFMTLPRTPQLRGAQPSARSRQSDRPRRTERPLRTTALPAPTQPG